RNERPKRRSKFFNMKASMLACSHSRLAFVTARQLPFLKNKECRHHDKKEANRVVPLDVLLQIENGENRKNNQGDDLLNRLELRCIEGMAANTIGGHLKAVFKKRDAPTHQRHLPQRDILVLEMAVPGDGHKDVGEGQQNNGQH